MANQLYSDLYAEISTYLVPEDIRQLGLVSKNANEGTTRELFNYVRMSMSIYNAYHAGKRVVMGRYTDYFIPQLVPLKNHQKISSRHGNNFASYLREMNEKDKRDKKQQEVIMLLHKQMMYLDIDQN